MKKWIDSKKEQMLKCSLALYFRWVTLCFTTMFSASLKLWHHILPYWRRQWHPTPVLLPGKSHGQRTVEGCSLLGGWGSDTTGRLHFHFHALEKEMATHSGVLAWGIPGTGEPGGLPSMGSHRVGHDWSDLAAFCLIKWWGISRISINSHC